MVGAEGIGAAGPPVRTSTCTVPWAHAESRPSHGHGCASPATGTSTSQHKVSAQQNMACAPVRHHEDAPPTACPAVCQCPGTLARTLIGRLKAALAAPFLRAPLAIADTYTDDHDEREVRGLWSSSAPAWLKSTWRDCVVAMFMPNLHPLPATLTP
eukprot:307924-Chlamydomonas_euryale.AAC.10